MNSFFKKNGFVGGVTIIVIVLAIVVILWNKLVSNKRGSESMYGSVGQYSNIQAANGANPTNPIKQYQQVKKQNQLSQNELLPNDTNSDWAAINPSGNGELNNINLLKAGSMIGIDTIGSSLRNANLQIRSEPPNPQLNTGPWNQSTITPDFMRVPLEIGCGKQ